VGTYQLLTHEQITARFKSQIPPREPFPVPECPYLGKVVGYLTFSFIDNATDSITGTNFIRRKIISILAKEALGNFYKVDGSWSVMSGNPYLYVFLLIKMSVIQSLHELHVAFSPLGFRRGELLLTRDKNSNCIL
jgi:hypothetical protein